MYFIELIRCLEDVGLKKVNVRNRCGRLLATWDKENIKSIDDWEGTYKTVYWFKLYKDKILEIDVDN